MNFSASTFHRILCEISFTGFMNRSITAGMYTGFFATLLAFLVSASAAICLADAPDNLNGKTVTCRISEGFDPLASSGYFAVIIPDSGDSFSIIGIGEVTDVSGTYSYRKTSRFAASLTLWTAQLGTLSVGLDFSQSSQSGVYTARGISYQFGTFLINSGAAPQSVSGLRLIFSINSGFSPFASSGSFSLSPDGSSDSYTIRPDAGVATSSGTYSVAHPNSSSLLVSLRDSRLGKIYGYLAFTSSSSGTYAIRT